MTVCFASAKNNQRSMNTPKNEKQTASIALTVETAGALLIETSISIKGIAKAASKLIHLNFLACLRAI